MKCAGVTVNSCSPIVNAAALLSCLHIFDILSRLSALKVKVDVFQWTEVMFCNFRMIKLIVISWRIRALVHSACDNEVHELQNIPTTLSQFILLILLIRILMAFSCKRS